MPVFLIAVDSEQEEREITDQEVILGRSFLEQCDDTRISRAHGVLKHLKSSDNVQLKATHTNPLFFKHQDDPTVHILKKDEEKHLIHNDKFGFLPDKHWFRISVQNPEQFILRVRQIEELNDSQNFAEIIPQVSNGHTNDDNASQNDIIIPTPQLSPNASEAQKRTHESPEDEENDSNKRQKTNDNDMPCQSNDPCSSTTSSNTCNQPPATTIIPEVTVKKEEPDSTDDLRDSCEFGIGCYRRNIEHRREFAHPGDTDYRRPNYPPAPPGTPMCPYQQRCYRRNPDHFIEYSHPLSSTTAAGSSNNAVASSPSPRKKKRQPKKVKAEPTTTYRDETSEEEEEDEDFSADSSDSFNLNNLDDNGSSSDEDFDNFDTDEEDDDNLLDDGDANEI